MNDIMTETSMFGTDAAFTDPLMRMIADYTSIDCEFYDLYPKAADRRLAIHYNSKTKKVDGLYHSEDDQPVITREADWIYARWYRHGYLHRETGPAEIAFDLTGQGAYFDTKWDVLERSVQVRYYQHGFLHRVDGPAVVFHGVAEHFLYGVEVPSPFDKYDVIEEVPVYCIPDIMLDVEEPNNMFAGIPSGDVDLQNVYRFEHLHMDRRDGYKAWKQLAADNEDLFLNGPDEETVVATWKELCDAKLDIMDLGRTRAEVKQLPVDASFTNLKIGIMLIIEQLVTDLIHNTTPVTHVNPGRDD